MSNEERNLSILRKKMREMWYSVTLEKEHEKNDRKRELRNLKRLQVIETMPTLADALESAGKVKEATAARLPWSLSDNNLTAVSDRDIIGGNTPEYELGVSAVFGLPELFWFEYGSYGCVISSKRVTITSNWKIDRLPDTNTMEMPTVIELLERFKFI